jgi:ribosomal protein L40E
LTHARPTRTPVKEPGPAAAAKLLLVPKGETRSFEAVFAIPVTEQRPRLSYRGVTKAQVVTLPALEGAAPPQPPPATTPEPSAKRLCPKCKAEAAPDAKFCDECGTKLTPK